MRSAILILLTCTAAIAADDPVLSRVAAHADRYGAISRQIWEAAELAFELTNGLVRKAYKLDRA